MDGVLTYSAVAHQPGISIFRAGTAPAAKACRTVTAEPLLKILTGPSIQRKKMDTGFFGWDRIPSLHSSWHWAVFWICNESRVGGTGIFWLLLSSIKAFCASHPTPPVRRVGCTGSWDKAQQEQGTSHTMGGHAQGVKLGQGGARWAGDVQSDGV